MSNLLGRIATASRYLARVRQFRVCVAEESALHGRLEIGRRLLAGGLASVRNPVSTLERKRRWKTCRRCPLLDTETLKCQGCGCYAPFLLTVDRACHARISGMSAPWNGWTVERLRGTADPDQHT